MDEFLGKKEKNSRATNVRRGDMRQVDDERKDARQSTSLGDKNGWRECQKRTKRMYAVSCSFIRKLMKPIRC